MSDSLSWKQYETGPGEYAFNMALDEALLEAMPRIGCPVFRFYGWTQPAASFGYFQKYVEVERMTPLRPLVRRPTGGGIVPHKGDWTYSVTVPAVHPWYALLAIESYRRMHEWIREAFACLGIEAELALQPQRQQAGQCFLGYEQFDVLLRGRKIAGAAQRRRRDGLLIQGSVQPGFMQVPRTDWQRAMYETLRLKENVCWNDLVPDAALRERAAQLAKEKYSQPAYNQKR